MQDLDKFKNEMNLSGKNVYVGHRYVPKIMGDWTNSKTYEALSIVQYQGNSFTSRQYVPTGIEITNEEYWASTGNYNAQVENYRQEVTQVNNELVNARNGELTLTARLEKDYQEVTSLLTKTDGKYSKLIEMLENGEVTKIKLVGDSITAGVGSSDYGLTENVMFTDTSGVTHYKPNNHSNGYANLLRKFINKHYPSVTVENWGVGGKSVKWAYANRESLIDDNESVVISMFGMNDRVESQTIEIFERYTNDFLEYVDARSDLMIVMSPQPAQEYTNGVLNSPYIRDVRAINKIIEKVVNQHDYIFIPNYDMFFDYVTTSGSSLDTLVEVGGSHPIDAGHELIWKNIQSRLHLQDDYTDWLGLTGSLSYEVKNQNVIRIDTPITDKIFKNGKTAILEVASNHPDITEFPAYNSLGGIGGRLITVKPSTLMLNARQFYLPRQSNLIYSRYWSNGWSEFVQIAAPVGKSEQGLITEFELTANTHVNKVVEFTEMTLSASSAYAFTMNSAITVPYNWRVSTAGSNNAIVITFINHKDTAVSVPNVAFTLKEV